MSTGAYGPADLKRDLNLSDDAIERMEAHRTVLAQWAARINLVGPGELEQFWRRHALDSAQLARLAPEARRWIDLGSGAGFPGLPIACALANTPGAEVTLVESNPKKAAFLREATRAARAPARVLNARIEAIGALDCDVVTARALAPLKRLIEHAKPILDRGAQGLFLKGAEIDAELAAADLAQDGGACRVDVLKSLSDPSGRIVRLIPAAALKLKNGDR